MTQGDILDIALNQSAIELNTQKEYFLQKKNIVVISKQSKMARAYYKEPISCNLVSYGNNIIASVKEEYREIIEEYINRFEHYHCFETPSINYLNEKLFPYNQKVCFMAEYFLPDLSKLQPLNCKYKTIILHQSDFEDLYLPQWKNALCKDRKHLDVLGIGAFDNKKMVGFAACSADCENMWQIGVDVLNEYRNQGIASALTSNLAIEILKRNKVPFYCCAWSNIPSARNAIKSGFVPAWVEMTVKPKEIVDKYNS